jgi:hypothetical protein
MTAHTTAIPSTAAAPALATDPLLEGLSRLARGVPEELQALVHEVEVNAVIAGTRVSCHCYSLKIDGNGRPRIRDFVKAICDAALDYAIPRSEIADAHERLIKTGSTSALMRLRDEALSAFTELEQSGEGGELLLFTVAEKLLKLPQIICKMALKTSSEMHFHGADGVHAGVDDDSGRLLLYWGESKIYEKPSDAIRECLKSVAPMLLDNNSGGAASDRDFTLLRRYMDLDNEALEAALKRFLNPQDAFFNSLELAGLCLVGFDCDAYPKADQTAQLNQIVDAIGKQLPSWKKQIANRIAAENLTNFNFHFITVPFPSAQDFRERFRKELGIV